MRTPLMRIVGVGALTAALALSATACSGGGDKKAACDKLQKTIADVGRKGMTQINDPAGLAQTYAEAAGTLRQEGKEAGDGDVEKAANHAATALETIGQQVKTAASGGSTTPQMPNSSGLISAGIELKSACGG
ncbi:hypothetical protein ACRYCC_38300 [Actinomadura scrupuli]|uniref:hypothetical protein n=1 Tax=Actinomadura scrupuli TaxID=559629 RepID=UPI003D968335